jgi:integrase
MRLGQVLDTAWERELIDSNPVRKNPRKRKVKVHAPARPYLDRAEQIGALLDAAACVDEASVRVGRGRLGRRAIVATLTLAGLRVGELCALRWRDVDLASGRLTVGDAKTDAGRRSVDLLPCSGTIGHHGHPGRVDGVTGRRARA